MKNDIEIKVIKVLVIRMANYYVSMTKKKVHNITQEVVVSNGLGDKTWQAEVSNEDDKRVQTILLESIVILENGCQEVDDENEDIKVQKKDDKAKKKEKLLNDDNVRFKVSQALEVHSYRDFKVF